MVGQKQRIIRRFEKESRKHLKEKGLSHTFLDTTMFSLADIKKIIMFDGYACGHKGKPIFLDDNELSITAFYEWCESVGWKGDKSECWECWCVKQEKTEGGNKQ